MRAPSGVIYDKIVDYKVEYGHGCGNYIAQDEPYISNETTTLFNLLRVWNIGNYLDPDEDAQNATIRKAGMIPSF